MKFYNIYNPKEIVSLEKAVLENMPKDGKGLYYPLNIPENIYNSIDSTLNYNDFVKELSRIWFQEDFSQNEIEEIFGNLYFFEPKLVELEKNLFCLELFNGPTLSFKDFGARYLAALVSHFMKKSQRPSVVLAATSGDTGSAVAQGFLGMENVKVILIYPKGKVSKIQESQLTTIGQNVFAIEVNGNFDDCQKLVKEAFIDESLKQKINLLSANSINVGRFIPQSFYYMFASKKLGNDNKIIYSIPSGNFGNLASALLSLKMGNSINQLIASTNANNVVPDYLETGEFKAKPTISTLSNAMDIGNPSNFQRVIEPFKKDVVEARKMVKGFWFDDENTKNAIKEVYKKYSYVVCPHTAIAYLGIKNINDKNIKNVFVGTAHPAKFKDIVENEINSEIQLPKILSDCLKRKKVAEKLDKINYKDFKNIFIQIIK